MIASSGSWGKIRSVACVPQAGDAPYPVELNVDARPFVSIDGPIQLELTLDYAPLKGPSDPQDPTRQRPTGINQSQTVVLQSGKPLDRFAGRRSGQRSQGHRRGEGDRPQVATASPPVT